jgi:riboflavin synthase
VTEVNDDLVAFDLMAETLRLTNLGALQVGDRVNVERAAKFGDEIGGHAMSGHIIAWRGWTKSSARPITARYGSACRQNSPNMCLPRAISVLMVAASPSVRDGNRFCVHLIPETLERTIIQFRQPGDAINIEIDPQTQAIVDTVERVLAQRMRRRPETP